MGLMMKIDNVMVCTVPGQVDLAIEGVRVIPVELKDKVRNLYNLCIKECRKQTKTFILQSEVLQSMIIYIYIHDCCIFTVVYKSSDNGIKGFFASLLEYFIFCIGPPRFY